MTIYANATRSYTTSSAHAMRVRERLGLRALFSHVFACISTDRPTCNQLLYVVVQLHYQSTSWNVRLRSTLLAYMLDLLSQLSRAGSGWHTSTTVGIHRHICATSPLLFACFPKKISSTVILQIGDSWNISAAKLVGGARLRRFYVHTRLILSYQDYPEITGTTAIIPTSTSKAAQTVTSSTSLFSTSTVGAIAGGIVSGILGVALLSGVVAWFVVRRRRARSAISSIFSSDQEGELEQPASYPLLTIETPTTLYVSIYFSILVPKLIWPCVLPRTLRIQ